jgi:hypothetical protein
MHKTLGNILIFLGSAGLIANAVQYLARKPFSGAVLPISIAVLVIGAGLIRFARKSEQSEKS